MLELAIGLGLYAKTGPQVDRLMSQLTTDGAAFFAAERPRMSVVQRNFVILESVWLVLIASSAVIAVWQERSVTISGIAFALLVNTAVLLTFDIIAERRGSQYFEALQRG